MVLGRYGIGLIGFWCVGKMLEMKSRVGGERAWTLRMLEDRAQGRVEEDRSRKVVDEDTWTEVSILGIHPAAVPKIRPPRLQAYLANELRGQLLEREAVVRITDRVARGRARKLFVVEPRPYLGRPLEQWRTLEVPGFESARVELYAVAPDEERHGVVALSCGGTVVLDDIAEIDGADQQRDPWDRGLLEGVIDFPELYVAPGSRRGFAHDEPVTAFLEVLGGLEREILRHFEDEKRRRAALRQESLAQDIRKAFRLVANRLPAYDFFPVRGGAASARGGSTGDDGRPEGPARRRRKPPPREARRSRRPRRPNRGPRQPRGPARRKSSRMRDTSSRPVRWGGSRSARPDCGSPRSPRARLRARALDADGRPCAGDVVFAWQPAGPGELQADGGPRDLHGAGPGRGRGRTPRPAASSSPCRARRCRERGAGRSHRARRGGQRSRTSGIPEPRPVSAPGERLALTLRRRPLGVQRRAPRLPAASETEARRLRYLVNLFAKEIVLRNFGGPGDGGGARAHGRGADVPGQGSAARRLSRAPWAGARARGPPRAPARPGPPGLGRARLPRDLQTRGETPWDGFSRSARPRCSRELGPRVEAVLTDLEGDHDRRQERGPQRGGQPRAATRVSRTRAPPTCRRTRSSTRSAAPRARTP